MIYYRKPMHTQRAFEKIKCTYTDLTVTNDICDRVLSLPMHPYLTSDEQNEIVEAVKEYLE